MQSEKSLLLVVEDNPTQQRVIQILAEKFGFLVLVVGTGEEALKALAACDSCFAAILMDLEMPDMDGLECTKLIRNLEKDLERHTPIIAVTAHSSVENRNSCRDAGMDDYLSKPFGVEEFRKILLKWAYKSERPNLKLLPNSLDDAANG